MTLHVSYMLIHRFFNHCFFCHILQAIFAEMMTHPGLIVGATPGVVAVVASETPSAMPDFSNLQFLITFWKQPEIISIAWMDVIGFR